MAEATKRVLALTISAGSIYPAVVECPNSPIYVDTFERLDRAQGLESSAQLADFSVRFKQELRRIGPAAVGVLNTRKYGAWKYADAFSRVSLEAVVMLAVEELSSPGRTIRYVLITREGLPKAVGLPADRFEERAQEQWGPGLPRYAKERSMAFATAIALAQRECK